MKLLSAIIALIVVVFSVVYLTDTSVASTATITYVSPVGTLSGPPANLYEFTSTTGGRFDIQLSNDNFSSMLETLSNKADSDPFVVGIQIQSTVLNSLSSGTYQWRAKDHADASFSNSTTFTIP